MSPLPRRPRFRRRDAVPVETRDGSGTAAAVAQYRRLNLRLRARMHDVLLPGEDATARVEHRETRMMARHILLLVLQNTRNRAAQRRQT